MLALVVGRMRALYWVHAISEPALRRMLSDAPLAKLRAESVVAGVLLAVDEEGAREALLDARELAGQRLRLLRVCATLASTLGLLGGILLLANVAAPDVGLSALEAGGAARARLNAAIATMAIGVGSSAFCFQALSLLRTAAQRVLSQAERAARARSL